MIQSWGFVFVRLVKYLQIFEVFTDIKMFFLQRVELASRMIKLQGIKFPWIDPHSTFLPPLCLGGWAARLSSLGLPSPWPLGGFVQWEALRGDGSWESEVVPRAPSLRGCCSLASFLTKAPALAPAGALSCLWVLVTVSPDVLYAWGSNSFWPFLARGQCIIPGKFPHPCPDLCKQPLF